jgi:hypothetical protein
MYAPDVRESDTEEGKLVLNQLSQKLRQRRAVFSVAVAVLLVAAVIVAFTRPKPSLAAQGAPFHDFQSYVQYIASHHKAPFDRDVVITYEKGGATFIKKQPTIFNPINPISGPLALPNYKVNQDRNPWPKAELGAAVDPTNGNNYVVMANDFRENYDHQFYHVSTNGGTAFTDDSMTVGVDGVTGSPYNFQSDPGVAFDSTGHSYISNISGNLIFDFTNGYVNTDTEIDVVQGFAHGTYTNISATPVDFQACNGLLSGTILCQATLDKPLITVDNVPGSPHKGSIYAYYTIFCNVASCTDGSATIPGFSSAILAVHSPGAGFPFSSPQLVSGSLRNTQFSDMVIDSHGTPHIFFDDFTTSPVRMFESTLSGGSWVVNPKPVATFIYTGVNNPFHWSFRDAGAAAPGCGIYKDTAYCAFSAEQVNGDLAESTPSVYVARINTLTGASAIHRVNNDAFGDTKHHFFAWATAAPSGAVYVGWYDDRNDPFDSKVQYFVAKSTNGTNSFAVQKAVSSASFNPCIGFPGCSFFGDYTQLVAGPDGVIHAAWSDTRDGASMQIYTARITW